MVKRSNGRMVEWSKKNKEYSDLTNCKNVKWSNGRMVKKKNTQILPIVKMSNGQTVKRSNSRIVE